MEFTIQMWCITYLDPVCLWSFPNVDQINCVCIVHMLPIEELPSKRAGIVTGLSSQLNSDVNCLDNHKLDFQITLQGALIFPEQSHSFSVQLPF